MIYDRLLTLVERHLPDLERWAKQARIFDFPHIPHETLSQEISAEQSEFIWDTFFLPFQVVAVEDPASCVILWDEEPDAPQGYARRRYFIEGLPLDGENLDAFRESQIPGAPKPPVVADKHAMIVTAGYVEPDALLTPETFGVNYQLKIAFQAGLTKTDVTLSPEMYAYARATDDRYWYAVLGNVKTAMEEISYFNSPDRFVVEKGAPVGTRVPKGRTPRSDQRPVYKMMTVTEIRTMFREAGVADPDRTGTKRVVHERRRHFRKYPDDPVRWPNAHGKVIEIPASWAGSREAQIGKRIWRVRTDL